METRLPTTAAPLALPPPLPDGQVPEVVTPWEQVASEPADVVAGDIATGPVAAATPRPAEAIASRPPSALSTAWRPGRDAAAPAVPEDAQGPGIASLEPSESSDLQFVRSRSTSGLWTIPLLCAGIAILACCLLIPAADENRRLTWERERLRADLEQIQKQVRVNDAFLQGLMADPTLSERLARRQMKMVREGTSVLEMKTTVGGEGLSPFLLVTLPPPAEMPPYEPVGGVLAELCRNPKSQLYLTGAGLLMIACGLVLGSSAPIRE